MPGNSIGVVNQGGRAPSPAAAGKDPQEKEACIFCGSDKHPTPHANRPWNNKKKSPDYVNNVMNNHAKTNASTSRKRKRSPTKQEMLTTSDESNPLCRHPWYSGPYSIQVHHLIEGKALKTGDWELICEAFGYDVNTASNCLSLPFVKQLACFLKVPLHRGPHTSGKTDVRDRTAGSPSKTPVYLMYPDAVAQKIDTIQLDLFARCMDPDELVKRMNKASQEIFDKLSQFLWKIRADGDDYAPGGKGCQIQESAPYGQCTPPPSAASTRSRQHQTLQDLIGSGARFRPTLGM